ncbi:MAG: hypothetical protein WCG45_04350, partial [bacterium]
MEKITFKSPEQISEEKKRERLLNEGGIFYEKIKDEETGKEKSIVNILGVEIETYASKEDIQKLKEEIILSNLDQTLLRKTAECYKLKQPILFEGDPGAGKTFIFEKFVEMIYGAGCPIDTLVGTPRTSELDILGHWAPRGEKRVDSEEYNNEIIVYQNSPEFKALSEEFNQRLSTLNNRLKNNEINQEGFENEFSEISSEFTKKQKDSITSHFSKSLLSVDDSDWEFKQGALLRAYSGTEGKGYPLIIDEFNLIPSNYQQIFLQISGQSGGLSDKVSFWGNGGITSYHRGKETALFFASNFPEKTEGRSEVVAPMSDRLVWTILSDKEYKDKKRAIIETAGGRLQNRKSEVFKIDPNRVSVPVENGLQWDRVLDEKLGEQIADVVFLLANQFENNYQEVGDKLTYNGETRKRTQRLEFSSRNAMRLFSYIDKFQVRGETGNVDFTDTLKRGYEMYYVSRLADVNMQKKAWKIFDELLTGDTGKIKFEKQFTLKQQVEQAEAGKKLSDVSTRKEVLDYLVEKAEQESKNENNTSKEKEIIYKIQENDNLAKFYLKFQQGVFDKETKDPLKKSIYQSLKNAFTSNGDMIISDDSPLIQKYANAGIKKDNMRFIKLTGSSDSNVSESVSLLKPEDVAQIMILFRENRISRTKFQAEIDSIVDPEMPGAEGMSRTLDLILERYINGEIFKPKNKNTENKYPFECVFYTGYESNDEQYVEAILKGLSTQKNLKDKKFVIFSMEDQKGWTGNRARVNVAESTVAYNKIIKLLESGFSEPVILTGFMTPEMILNYAEKEQVKTTDGGVMNKGNMRPIIEPLFKKILSYKNVKFLQLPFMPEELAKVILEKDNTNKEKTKKKITSQST